MRIRADEILVGQAYYLTSRHDRHSSTAKLVTVTARTIAEAACT